MFIMVAFLVIIVIQFMKWQNFDWENYFSFRMYYIFQLILGCKFSENFFLQVLLIVVYWNLVKIVVEVYDVYVIVVVG